MTTEAPSIADQIATFNEGFAAAVPAEIGAVFGTEQADLESAGLPEGVITVGTPLPAATLVDTDGSSVELKALLGNQSAVIVFYRGAWCPYCSVTLAAYQQQLLPALEATGTTLVAISPQTPDASLTAKEKGELTFPVLSDLGNVFARELGIVTQPSAEARSAQGTLGFDVADSNADGTAEIPFPTVLVVDGEGTVRFIDVQVNYTIRTEPGPILDAVAAL